MPDDTPDDPRDPAEYGDGTAPDDTTAEGDSTTADDSTTGSDEDEEPEDDDPDSAGLAAPDPADRLARASATDPQDRSDASGRDVTPPPAAQPAGQNPGLATEDDPEGMDFREFDTGARWTSDRPAPDRLEADTDDPASGPPISDSEDAEATDSAAGGDLTAAVTAALEGEALLDLYDLTVERAGDTIILRGSAATPEDRDRAATSAGSVAGVGRVQNLISAG